MSILFPERYAWGNINKITIGYSTLMLKTKIESKYYYLLRIKPSIREEIKEYCKRHSIEYEEN